MWDNSHGLVFTTALGAPLDQRNVDYQFRRIAAAAGLEHVRFHDTRHTYAVNSIRAGDDIKTIQGNLENIRENHRRNPPNPLKINGLTGFLMIIRTNRKPLAVQRVS